MYASSKTLLLHTCCQSCCGCRRVLLKCITDIIEGHCYVGLTSMENCHVGFCTVCGVYSWWRPPRPKLLSGSLPEWSGVSLFTGLDCQTDLLATVNHFYALQLVSLACSVAYCLETSLTLHRCRFPGTARAEFANSFNLTHGHDQLELAMAI